MYFVIGCSLRRFVVICEAIKGWMLVQEISSCPVASKREDFINEKKLNLKFSVVNSMLIARP